jgi:hypothetical protein
LPRGNNVNAQGIARPEHFAPNEEHHPAKSAQNRAFALEPREI